MKPMKFRVSAITVGVLLAMGSGGAAANTTVSNIANVYILGNTDNSVTVEGVYIGSTNTSEEANIGVYSNGNVDNSGAVYVYGSGIVSLNSGSTRLELSPGEIVLKGNTFINHNTGSTTYIATHATATTNIGMVGGTNNLAGTTNINASVNNNTNINTSSSTGAVTIGNAAAGNITLQSATNSYLVVGDTGTAVTGTLSSTGNFSVNESQFTVNATNGNTAVAGTLGVTGATTLNNTLAVDSNGATAQASGNGLLNVTNGSVNMGVANSTTTMGGNFAATSTQASMTGGGTTNSIVVNSTTNTVLGTTLINSTGNGNTTIGTVGASGSTNQILGLNNTITATDTNAISGATNNITASSINNIEAPTNNIGVATASSINTIGNNGANTTVTGRGGNTTLSLVNNTASLTAGPTLATNGTSGITSGANSGGLTIYNSAQTIGVNTTIQSTLLPTGILVGKTYQNKINGNLFVDGNVYINGTLDYVSRSSANTTVIGATSATSNLAGATTATTGGTAIVMKGATGTQTVVDANGGLTNVTGLATQSSASLTLTNGIGNTHGLVVTETQATLSGGAHSSSLTLGDNGATFSDSATGAPVQVHGVNDGTADFDAVNVRQFAGAIASVTAMANIPQVDTNKTVAVGMGLGSFMGKTALAAGVTYRFAANGVVKGSVSSAMNSSKSTAVGVGAAWSY